MTTEAPLDLEAIRERANPEANSFDDIDDLIQEVERLRKQIVEAKKELERSKLSVSATDAIRNALNALK